MSKHDIVIGRPKIEPSRSIYKTCILGKQTRERTPCQSFHHSKTPLEIIHSDVCDPLSQLSLIKGWYILMFINDYSHYGWVYFLKNKSDIFGMFQILWTYVEKQLINSICILHSDEGGEYTLQHSVIAVNNMVSTNNLLNRTCHIKMVWQNKRTKVSWTWVVVYDALPSSLLDPSWVQVSQTSKFFGIWGTLPALSIKRGRGACWSSEMGLGKGTSFSYLLKSTSNQPTSWLVQLLKHL